MTKDDRINASLGMLYLCGCALTGKRPNAEGLRKTGLREIYAAGRFHSLSALAADALEGVEPTSPEEEQVLAAFTASKQRAIRKNLLLDTERQSLFEFMEQNGIWYMPLKGVILKDMYPKMGLRQMADNDILFDASRRRDIRDRFVARGYKIESYNVGNHDVYLKEPVYNYEMHISLFGENYSSEWVSYYRDVKSRLVKNDGTEYGYRFTDEDFYIYFLTHGFKHYDSSGTGVRFLIDLYVFLEKKRQTLDLDYIAAELRKLGLTEFERSCLELTDAIFSDVEGFRLEDLPPEKQEMLVYFLTSGTYGTVDKLVHNTLKREGKLGYVIKRIFPGTKALQLYHPMFRHKWLLPIGWIYRAFRILTKRPGNVTKELKTFAKTKKENENKQ